MRPLLPLLLVGCTDYDLSKLGQGPDLGEVPDACGDDIVPPEDCAPTDACVYAIGSFTPVVEWEVPGTNALALPVVGDLDGDGMPEIVVNESGVLSTGTPVAYHGDGSGELWRVPDARAGYGASPAIADVDDDGVPEVFIVREYASSMFGQGDYTVIRIDDRGIVMDESAHFVDREFDYASGVSVSDMDHDGVPELVVGRVILGPDLETRGVGTEGRGSPLYIDLGAYFQEGAQPAVVDLDLDGEEEVVVGNAAYGPDGALKWWNEGPDGAVSPANLDDDAQGEYVRTASNTITGHDTTGAVLWGPITHPSANIFPVPAIGDLDADGFPEIVVAGGNELWVLRRDGSLLWSAYVADMSGATGASIFDFDADGVPEVVYIDEVQVVAYNGADGAVKFQTNHHASPTMYDYPVIADVDADGHAEIVVTHSGFSAGMSVYGDATDSWAPARGVWNQHGYAITNIADDLSVPVDATPNFTVYNNYHAALPLPPGGRLGDELEPEILDACDVECDDGTFHVLGRLRNTGNRALPAGVALTLYARAAGVDTPLATLLTPSETPAGRTSESLRFSVPRDSVVAADALVLIVDDDGRHVGAWVECDETNNADVLDGPFCGGGASSTDVR
ncbi:MAG: hypothetical protein RLZZ299_809 [Pseudomonadota bacterium]